ncbi:MAG: ferredoxin reductase family protein [Acidobacteria bacterium]|nr:ferredoxin reductase family protein [Acidobacteriota bacterium]
MSVRGLLWLSLYLILITLPLGVATIWPGEFADISLLMKMGVAFGFLSFTILGLEFSLISKIQSVASAFGMDALIRFHRQMGLVATILVISHAVALVYNGYPLEWLNPFGPDTTWAMRWGLLSAFALLLLIIASVARQQLRIPYEWWQWTHDLLAKIVVVSALAHLLMVGAFSAQRPMQIVIGGCALLIFGISVYFQVIRPLRLWSRPWTVVENLKVSTDTQTLKLQPHNHPGFRFEPGQFAWLNTGTSPFHKDRHPISMSSAASDELGEPIEFTIKNLGDWSGKVVPALQPGTRIWVDGPYGVFTPDREQGPGYVLIGGGVGITPLLSMCETFAARGDLRPVYLFYGSASAESLRFKDRLIDLQTRMNLHVIYALEKPPEAWQGERGYITQAVLEKYLPAQHKRFQYFICGPGPMMDSIEGILPKLGIPGRQIHTERFVMV